MPKKIQLKKWDTQEFLRTAKQIRCYWEAAQAEAFLNDDYRMLLVALGHIAKARGIAKVAEEIGVTRAGLYKSLALHGRPEFATVIKVIRALGLPLAVPAGLRR
jgi:probable addiction module antidote protein